MDVGPSWDVEVEYLVRSIKSTESSYVAAQIFLFLALLQKFFQKYTRVLTP
jgi:hypothetical protein